ncbi:3-oxoacid CoA-transferase subunit B [Chakrabartyella piscis]|uniref:3-oxoacid CoA-transferase subunit B n=1 Tax=Chakrabartyella piscis TaxID=2918914 RepID=UPI002958CA32|nr:3-oxoacid CoA-transferase subunit B [Chakrabartyella piscis]
MNAKEIIANRIAKEVEDGSVVNLGIGLPTMVANYIPDDMDVTLHSENGFIGLDKVATGDEINPNITNAGGQPVTVKSSAVFFDSAMSFALIRGGHIDITVLGALEVDQKGNLANYMVPGKMVPGMGGAMDLVTGAKKVIVAMMHTAKGTPKILKECTLPLTGKQVVDLIITELAVFKVVADGLLLQEIHESTTVENVLELTGADVIVSDTLATFA